MIAILNYIISQAGLLIIFFINLLPASPFTALIPAFDSHFLRFINFVIPLPEMFAILQVYLTALLTYYGLRIVLRWLKVASA